MKSFIVQVALSGPELSTLADAAESRGMRVSDYLRSLAITVPATGRRTRDRAELQRQTLELTNLGWSKSEIASRLSVGREQVTRLLNSAIRNSKMEQV